MIDFHSHILPEIDDGAQSVEMSLEMLAESYNQGVRTVIATPHCYISHESDIDEFIQEREQSYKILMHAIAKDKRTFPNIVLGSEVQVSTNVHHFEKIFPLCIENTNYILIEMPYTKWTEDCYDFIYDLLIKGMRPIIAHIERYISRRKEFHNLFSFDLLYQVNADSFFSPLVKRHIPDLFTMGSVQFLGSDMHNTTRRPTNMKKAADRIIKSYGRSRLNYLMNNAELVLKNEPVIRRNYEPMSFFKKLTV